MRLQRAVLTGLVLALATTTMSVADAAPRPAPKKLCNLVVDDAGDWKGGTYSGQASSAVDVLSADISTGKTEFVAVIRVPTTDTSSDTWRKLGSYEWLVGATLNGVDYKVKYRISGTTDRAEATAEVGNTTPPVVATVGPNTITWKIKRSDLPSLSKRANQVFTRIHATTKVWGGSADTATAEQHVKYPDKAPSCVVAK